MLLQFKKIPRIKIKLVYLLAFILFASCAFSQQTKSEYIDLLNKLENSDSTKLLFRISTNAIDYALKNKSNDLYAKSIEIQSNIYNKIGQYQKALSNGYELIQYGEKNNDKTIIIKGNIIVAATFFHIKDMLKSLKYFKKAENILHTLEDQSDELKSVRENIGVVYTSLPNKKSSDLDSALHYFTISKTSLNKKTNIASAHYYFKLGNVYVQKNMYNPQPSFFSNAIQNYDSASHYAELDKNNVLLGKILTNKARLFYDAKQIDVALNEYLKAIQYSREGKDYEVLLTQYDYARYIYELQNNIDSAYSFRENWVSINDSLHKYESLKQANELEIKYETEKKEQENLLLTKDNEKKQLGIYFSIGALILAIGVLFLIYRNSIQKTKTNKLLAHKNVIIEEQHKSITDSIKYAQRIQGAILPPNQMWFSIFPKSFVLYKPKDILSGDFYWIEETEDWKFVGAADCTGHGVPGALMSIVNYNLLNKAVLEKNLTMPGEILDSANQLLTHALHQTYQESTVKDGMDITLLSINKKTKEVYFAGANNPIYILGPNKDIEMKGDKFPVGAFVGETIRSFTTHKLQLETGDRIFLFSDGYADQFGGPKGKKLKYKQMKDALLESLSLDFIDQKNHIEKVFDTWRGNLEQVDDVLVIGLDIA